MQLLAWMDEDSARARGLSRAIAIIHLFKHFIATKGSLV